MKIRELIKKLEEAEKAHGDVECLIEVHDYELHEMLPVRELSYENREDYGPSISLLS